LDIVLSQTSSWSSFYLKQVDFDAIHSVFLIQLKYVVLYSEWCIHAQIKLLDNVYILVPVCTHILASLISVNT
jgi:hypothetical protein